MKKIFLYLYPIEEYTKMFLLNDDKLYDELNIKRPLPILNECIQKRYRKRGYHIVFALYPDKDIYGINVEKEDKIIYTDITFSEATAIDEDKSIKKNFIPKYPNELLLIKQLGDVDELVVGGYHAQDCVKRVADTALNIGIPTIIDLDMTDLFFSLYKKDNYFKIEEYSPIRYKDYVLSQKVRYGVDFIERHFNETYNSLAYGFSDTKGKIKNNYIKTTLILFKI